MNKVLLTLVFLALLVTSARAQYFEDFNTPNKGYLLNCVYDFTSVNWTLTPWDPSGSCRISPPDAVTDLRDPQDYFQTTGGKLQCIDLDDEVCWQSPLLNISAAGSVRFQMGLTWTGFDTDDLLNSCSYYPGSASLDYIKVMYSVNGGAYTMLPNVAGGATCATIGYVSGSTPPATGYSNILSPFFSGNTLQIRVCIGTNANAELVTIDSVQVPYANVTVGCAAPVLSTAVTPVGCNGPNTGAIDLTVSAGTPGYSYAWTGGATTQDLSNIPAGTYTVTVTDAAMCSATTSATVANDPPIVLSALYILNASCAGAPNGGIDMALSGGFPGYTYAWSNGTTMQDLFNAPNGTYTVTVTDAATCTASASATIGVAPMIEYVEHFNIPNKGYKTNFEDDFAVVSWSMSSWTPEPPAAFGRDAQDYFATSGGFLQAVDLDQEVCWISPLIDISASATSIIQIGGLSWTGLDNDPNDYINIKYSVNGGAYFTIPNVVGGGAGTIQYTSGLDNNGATDVYKFLAGGSTLQIQICGNFNANAEAMAVDFVRVYYSTGVACPAPMASGVATNLSCNGGTNGSILVTGSSGSPPYNVSWAGPSSGDPAGIEINASGGTYNITNLVAGTYTVSVTDANLLTGTTTVTVNQPAVLSLSTSVTNVLCNGNATGAINLTVSGGTTAYSYSWSNLPGSPDPEDQTGLTAGTYTVTVTDMNGCTQSTAATVTQPSAIFLSTVVTNSL
ncbi:MAG: SprB repeat-containing protein [Lewinellaceae bacterium]|nr:SprB repeat-containing protein [Lewinellaceae bacterium]